MGRGRLALTFSLVCLDHATFFHSLSHAQDKVDEMYQLAESEFFVDVPTEALTLLQSRDELANCDFLTYARRVRRSCD